MDAPRRGKEIKMEIFGLNTVFLILFFVPGYIYIQTVDHFLLKRDKTQFEKTIQGLIASMMIWILFYLIRWQPLNNEKEAVINLIILRIQTPNNPYVIEYLIKKLPYIAGLFLLLCFYSFIAASVFATIRKTKLVANIIQLFTGRDYFQNVEFRFYTEGINKTVILTMKNGFRYVGILEGSPDQENDKKIIVSDPYIIENKELVKLRANRLLVDTNNVDLLELF